MTEKPDAWLARKPLYRALQALVLNDAAAAGRGPEL